MSEKEEKRFQSSSICWICEKVIDHDDEKFRDQCHATEKFKGAAHWSCNKPSIILKSSCKNSQFKRL